MSVYCTCVIFKLISSDSRLWWKLSKALEKHDIVFHPLNHKGGQHYLQYRQCYLNFFYPNKSVIRTPNIQ